MIIDFHCRITTPGSQTPAAEETLGPERLLFGSDFPLYSQKRALKNARAALTEAEFALIASENSKRLLRL